MDPTNIGLTKRYIGSWSKQDKIKTPPEKGYTSSFNKL
jgi:hypothetical protein